MKQLVKNYSFNATAKTVTLSDYGTIALERLQLIIDVTSNVILYNFADASVTAASVATNVITLGSVGTAVGTDKLMIIYDSAAGDPLYDDTSNAVTGDTGQTAKLVAGSRKQVSFSTTTAQAVASTDVSNYRWVSIQITGQGTGSIVGFQGSNDNTNWVTVSLQEVDSLALDAAGSVTGTNIYAGPIQYRYFRLNVTGISAGTTAGVIEFFSNPAAIIGSSVLAHQSGTWAQNLIQIGGSALSLGQQLAAASIPVILPAATITTLTPPAAITNYALETGGNLATLAAAVSSSKFNVNISSGNITGYALDATLTGGTQQTKITNGTNLADVLSGDSGNNSIVTAGARKEVSFTTSTVQAVASTDVSNYRWVSVHITSQGGSSTVNFQGSNDNSNWVTVLLHTAGTSSSGGGLGNEFDHTTSTGIYYGPVNYRYFRLNVTGIASGTTAGVMELFANPAQLTLPSVVAVQNGTWNIGSSSNNALADGTSNPTTNLLASLGERFNGTTWDRERGNFDTAALITASGATTTQTGSDQTNYNGRGVKVVLDMTTVGTGSVTLEIDGKDAASGKYYPILTGAAVATNSTNVYEIFPGATAAANAVANSQLPRVWRVKVTANNANATTYTVGASVIL